MSDIRTPDEIARGCVVTPPEGNDSAESVQLDAISPEEILRIRRARAVAKRSIMSDLAHWCDAKARGIEAANPSRKKGSVSSVGQFGAHIAKSIRDHIWTEREKIGVPE